MSVSKFKYFHLLMWLLPLSFFGYQFILRLWPGLMMKQIMQQFSIDATSFGALAAIYYYGYSGMQIPTAMLLDRFGARYIVFASAILCGFSTLIFSFTDNLYLAYASRFFIGVGSAAGFLGTSKVVSEWFAKDSYARMIGFSFTVGLTGAIYGGKPVSILVENYGWQKIAVILSFVSIFIGISTYLFLRTPPNYNKKEVNNRFKLEDLKQVVSSPVLLLLALANFLMVGSLEGFADIWGVPYLMAAYSYSKAEAAALISFIFVGMLFGGPILTIFSQKFGNYVVISYCGVGMATIFLMLLTFNEHNMVMLAILFFCTGIMCCYQVLIFSAGCDLVDGSILTVTVAFLNCINMLGGSFFHTLIGNLMDLFWGGQIEYGLRQYSVNSYNNALMVIPICSLIGATMILLIAKKATKEKLQNVT